MKVSDIYSRRPVHIPQSCTLQDAARQMDKQHVGALLVTSSGTANGRVIGIVTDRDMVLGAIAKGADPLTTSVEQVMTHRVVSIEATASVSDAMQAMVSQGVRRLVVTEDESVAGVLSMDDVIGALGNDWAMLSGIVRAEQQRERSGSVQSPLHM